MYRIYLLMSLALLLSGCIFTSLEEPPAEIPQFDMGDGDEGTEEDLPVDEGPDGPEGCFGEDLELEVAAGSTLRLNSMGPQALVAAWSGEELGLRLVAPDEIIEVPGPELNIQSGDGFDVLGRPQAEGVDLVVAAIEESDLVLHRCTADGCESTKPDEENTFLNTVDLFGVAGVEGFFLGNIRKASSTTNTATVFAFPRGYQPNPPKSVVLFQSLSDSVFGSNFVRIAPLGGVMTWNMGVVASTDNYLAMTGTGSVSSVDCGPGPRRGKVLPLLGVEGFLSARESMEGVSISICDPSDPTSDNTLAVLDDYRDFDIAQNDEAVVVAWVDGNRVQAIRISGEEGGDVSPVMNIAEGLEVTNVAVEVSGDGSTVWFVVVDSEQAYLHQFEVADLDNCF